MTVNEFIEKAKSVVSDGWIIAALTDEYIVDRWPLDPEALKIKEGRVLEIRVFGKEDECKISRSDIGKEFAFRWIHDDEAKSEITYENDTTVAVDDHYDEWQILDIDEKKGISSEGKVTATGGGMYKLPLNSTNNARVLIRYYLGKYESTGQARIEDWRVVEFKEGV